MSCATAWPTGPITLYGGFDPTADSLHVGNLVPLLLLRRFQDAGHRPIALAGGATGMIGDPGGRSEERNLLDDATLDHNLAAIRVQLAQFVDLTPGRGLLVDNRDLDRSPWACSSSCATSASTSRSTPCWPRSRSGPGSTARTGISFTEFSYMLLQANDYDVLHQRARLRAADRRLGPVGQHHRRHRPDPTPHRRPRARPDRARWSPGPTGPSSASRWTGPSGSSPERTSPYAFYQYWINIDDRDVERFLLQLTLLPVAEVAEVVGGPRRRPRAARGAAPPGPAS